MSACPCGGPSFETCCGPRLDGTRPAETAEALMRSRYTAFARARVDYLRDTQLESTRDMSWEDTEQWTKSVHWVGLEIVDHQRGGPGDDTGIVEFIARYLEAGTVFSLRERSTFARRDGRWRYDTGSPEVTKVKVERNGPCPCGSGKKFKQCHA
jgi:SEC-C motif-containing protein